MNKGRDSRDRRRASFGLQSGVGRPTLLLGAMLLLIIMVTAGCSVVDSVDTTTTSEAAATTTSILTTTTRPVTTTTTRSTTTTTQLGVTTTTTQLGAAATTTTLGGFGSSGTTTTTLLSVWAPFGPQTPSSGVLYEIDDWSNGISGWAAAGPWTTWDGMLVADGSANAYTVAPVDLTGYPNYVVECEAQIVDPSAGTAVLLLARMINGTAYYGGFDSASSRMVIGHNNTELAGTGFVLDSGWHTYRLEVRGDNIKLYLEQAEVARAVDDRLEDAGTVGIYCGQGQVNIRSFKVTTL